MSSWLVEELANPSSVQGNFTVHATAHLCCCTIIYQSLCLTNIIIANWHGIQNRNNRSSYHHKIFESSACLKNTRLNGNGLCLTPQLLTSPNSGETNRCFKLDLHLSFSCNL